MSLATRIAQEFNSIRSEAAAQALLENKLAVSASGYITKVSQEDRWLETNTPNVIVDKIGDDYVIDGVVYSQLGPELVTNGDFSNGTTGWSGTSLSHWNGLLKVVNGVGGHADRAYQIITTEIGKTYKVSGYIKNISLETYCSIQARQYPTDATLGTVSALSSSGIFTFTFTAVGTQTKLNILTDITTTGTLYAYFDNISVKELKQATLPLAPFATGSTDELLDDKVNGLTTQVAHSKGDIVVTGNELVTNGTFDTDTSGWTATNATISVVSGVLRITNNSTTSTGRAYQTIDTEAGNTYILKWTYVGGTSNGGAVDTNDGTVPAIDSNRQFTNVAGKTQALTFTASSSQTTIILTTTGITSNYSDFDNISVRLADTTYQATRDTLDTVTDMYDGVASDSSIIYTGHPHVVLGDGTSNSIPGNYYVRADGFTGTINCLLDNFSVTTSWTNIGIASEAVNDLRNPKRWQSISDVTRHDIVTLNASGYKTFKGLHFYQDDNISYDKIASDRGWSKIGNNTFIDEDGVKCAIVGIVPRLNAGAFHPNYNFFGTHRLRRGDGTVNGAYWYYAEGTTSSTIYKSLHSLYDSFISEYFPTYAYNTISVGELSGRPDVRPYDKVYSQGEGGLIQLGYCYAIDKIDLDIEASRLVSGDIGIESGVECIGVDLDATTRTITHISGVANSRYLFRVSGDITSWADSYFANKLDGFYTVVWNLTKNQKGYVTGNSADYNNTSDPYFYIDPFITTVPQSYNFNWNVGDTVIFYKVGKSQTHLTKGTALTTDLIGNPTNYPSFLKNTLASGKSVHINPLLVGQDGTSYVSGTSLTTTFSNKANGFMTNTYYTVSNGLYSSGALAYTSITNNKTSVDATNYVNFIAYQSANKPAVQSTPKQVVKVQPKVVASNSHSKYKGAMVTNAVTGKVAVGNGTNGLESKVLENVAGNIVIPTHPLDSTSVTFGTLYPNVRIGVPLNITTRGEQGLVYKYIGTGTSGTLDPNTYSSFSATSLWQLVGSYTTPSHSTVTLDNSNSPSSKWFIALSLDGNEYCLDVYAKGLAYNGGTTSYDGDNELFDQLTNGTKTDINGNIVNTKVLTRRLGVFKK